MRGEIKPCSCGCKEYKLFQDGDRQLVICCQCGLVHGEIEGGEYD